MLVKISPGLRILPILVLLGTLLFGLSACGSGNQGGAGNSGALDSSFTSRYIFVGTLDAWIQNQGDKPGNAPPIVVGISSNHTQFEIATFSYPIPYGKLSLDSATTGSLSSNGQMQITLNLNFDFGLFGKSTLPILLTTGSVNTSIGLKTGSPLDASSQVTLVGDGQCIGGPLNKDEAVFTLTGRLVLAPPDGTLMREQSHPEIYVFYGAAKFWIPSPAEFNALGYNWANVQVVPDGTLQNYPTIPLDGTLLRELSSTPVYVIYGGAKFWIPSPSQFNALGYNWANVHVVPDGALAAIPPIPVDGTQLRELSSAPVYQIEGGMKVWISNPNQVFWNTLRLVPDGSLAYIPTGLGHIPTADCGSVTSITLPPPQASGSTLSVSGDTIRIDYTQNLPNTQIGINLITTSNVTWWKGLEVQNAQGVIVGSDYTQNTNHGPVSTSIDLNSNYLGLKLVFLKAKFLGIHTPVYCVPDLTYLRGMTVTFTWQAD
jgi:hypothetical protein